MDKGSLEELLDFILESIRYIKKRFLGINAADDFLENDTNITKLDAIAMRLQAIGETIRHPYKRDKNLLLGIENEEYWSRIVKTRDIISHHYINLDAEIIYEICENELGNLEEKVKLIKKRLDE
jgi:uncharacterized protein with HEPN domain